MTFNEIVNGWHDFYVLAGGAAATLTGLLFVAVSQHIDVMAHESAGTLRGIAVQILFNFIDVIVISLVIVSSAASEKLLCVFLVGLGIIGLARLFLRKSDVVPGNIKRISKGIRQQVFNVILHLLLPAICYITGIGCGIAMLIVPEQIDTILILIMFMIIYLLVRAIVDTWMMLIRVAIMRRSHQNAFTGKSDAQS